MRHLVILFGIIVGGAIVALAARYGYQGADIEADRWIMAFLYGAIAFGGLFGHAVAVRVWSLHRGAALFLWLVCAAALVTNLSNSVGALATRKDATLSDRAAVSRQAADLKAAISRLEARRDDLPAFVPTDAAALAVAQRAADTATKVRADECAKRGGRCRDREADERAALEALWKAVEAHAATNEAATLDGQIASQRAAMGRLPPVAAVNVQGDALAQLFRLPASDVAWLATWQMLLLAIVVEGLIIGAVIAAELLRPQTAQGAPREPAAVTTSGPAAALVAANDVAPNDVKALPAPRPTPRGGRGRRPRSAYPAQSGIDELGALLADVVEDGEGDVDVISLYGAYQQACRVRRRSSVPPDVFISQLVALVKAHGLPIREEDDTVYLTGARLKVVG